MPGYSSTALAKKLGIKSGFNVLLVNVPDNYFTLFTDLPNDLNFGAGMSERMDFIHFFTKYSHEYFTGLPLFKQQLKANGMIWVSWPKRSSKMEADISENIIRDYAISIGLIDIKVCAIDETWSGLKLVIPVEYRS